MQTDMVNEDNALSRGFTVRVLLHGTSIMMLRFRTATRYDFTLRRYDSDFVAIYDLTQSTKDI